MNNLYTIQNDEEYLEHHGILGQRWGHKNGPPYPLEASTHSAAEKRAMEKSATRKKLNLQKLTIKVQKLARIMFKQLKIITKLLRQSVKMKSKAHTRKLIRMQLLEKS